LGDRPKLPNVATREADIRANAALLAEAGRGW
jgi:hypothetical protein